MGDRLYKKVVFAGTFDHLHEGHKYILRIALKLSENLLVGLATEKLLARKKSKEKIQDYSQRHETLMRFFKDEGVLGRCEIFAIDTIEGGADKIEDLDALIVSDEMSVVNNAFSINELRAQNGLRRFHIIVIPRVRSQDGQPLSSSRRRDGESFDELKLRY
jgi:pantetheine-phosphate adenylyltransferase